MSQLLLFILKLNEFHKRLQKFFWCYDNDSEGIDSEGIDSADIDTKLKTLTVVWHWQCNDFDSANFKTVFSADLEYIMIWCWLPLLKLMIFIIINDCYLFQSSF
jgi:hypothetical protein